MRAPLVALVAAVAMALAGLPGGDPVAADAMYRWAVEESAGDPTHPAWVDAERELARIRPWQDGFAEARQRLREIEAVRRESLAP